MSPGGAIGSEILVKRWDMDTWEHLEMELEVVLWICFSRRTIFLVFEEKIFSNFFSLNFFHRQTFSSSFQWISLFRVLWITWNKGQSHSLPEIKFFWAQKKFLLLTIFSERVSISDFESFLFSGQFIHFRGLLRFSRSQRCTYTPSKYPPSAFLDRKWQILKVWVVPFRFFDKKSWDFNWMYLRD